MNWSDLQSAWSHQSSDLPEVRDLQLGATFEAKRRKWARRFFWRDAIEVGAGAFVLVVLGGSAWRRGAAYWPDAIAILLVAAVTFFFISERIRVYRQRIGPDASLLTRLDHDLAELKRQRTLLLRAGTWYVAPLMAAVFIFLATEVYNNAARLHAFRVQVFLVAYVLACGLLAWRITRMNRRAAQTKIEPWIAAIEKLRDELVTPPKP